jgi:hypothetical protein
MAQAEPGSQIVPTRPSGIVPTPPAWRRAIEGGTKLAVGLGAAAADAMHGPRPDSETDWGDAVVGVTLSVQRHVLDVAERVVDAGSGAAHTAASTTPGRLVLNPVRRFLQPFAARGHVAREEAVREARVAAPEYAGRVVDTVVDVVPLDEVLAHVDLNAVLQRVDVQAMLERVDINAMMSKVDFTALMQRVDINQIMDQVDVEALVENTEIGALIAKSTGGIATEVLDAFRRQGVGLDGFVFRWAQRIRRKKLKDAPLGPPLLVGEPA